MYLQRFERIYGVKQGPYAAGDEVSGMRGSRCVDYLFAPSFKTDHVLRFYCICPCKQITQHHSTQGKLRYTTTKLLVVSLFGISTASSQ